MYSLAPLENTASVSAFDSNAAGQLYAPPSNGTWIATTAGATWGGLPNWSSGLPNAQGAVANFVTGASVQHAVTVDGLRTSGAIYFNDPSKYTLGGTGAIVIDVASGAGAVTVTNGSHDITVPIALATGFLWFVSRLPKARTLSLRIAAWMPPSVSVNPPSANASVTELTFDIALSTGTVATVARAP